MQKIRHGDEVIVIAGKDEGKRGKVLKVLANSRLVVGRVSPIKRHTKPNPMFGQQDDITKKEAPLRISSVVILSTKASKTDRVDFKVEDGKEIRVFKSAQKPVRA